MCTRKANLITQKVLTMDLRVVFFIWILVRNCGSQIQELDGDQTNTQSTVQDTESRSHESMGAEDVIQFSNVETSKVCQWIAHTQSSLFNIIYRYVNLYFCLTSILGVEIILVWVAHSESTPKGGRDQCCTVPLSCNYTVTIKCKCAQNPCFSGVCYRRLLSRDLLTLPLSEDFQWFPHYLCSMQIA